MKALGTLLAGTTFLLACSSGNKLPASDASISQQAIEGKWTIETMYRDGSKKGEALTDVTIEFHTDSSFNGKAPCNRMSGQSIISAGEIRMSQILTTKMACPGIGQEGYLVNALENTVRTWSISADKLYLGNSQKETVLVASKAK